MASDAVKISVYNNAHKVKRLHQYLVNREFVLQKLGSNFIYFRFIIIVFRKFQDCYQKFTANTAQVANKLN